MGAVLAAESVIAPIVEQGAVFRHGITFGGHPVAAAIALKNMEIFERDGVLENVRTLDAVPRRDAAHAALTCRSSATSAATASSGRWSWSRTMTTRRFDQAERDKLLRGFLPGRLREAGHHRAR